MYALVITLSLIVCVMSFVYEVTSSNIAHMKNGRKPDAGASIFPVIPVVQILAALFAWGVNHLHPTLGFLAVIVLFVLFCILWIPSFLKARRELKELEDASLS